MEEGGGRFKRVEKWNKLFRFQGVESLKLSVGHFAGGFNRIDLMNVRDDGRWLGLVPRGGFIYIFPSQYYCLCPAQGFPVCCAFTFCPPSVAHTGSFDLRKRLLFFYGNQLVKGTLIWIL